VIENNDNVYPQALGISAGNMTEFGVPHSTNQSFENWGFRVLAWKSKRNRECLAG
jgi:hypothetical protein